MSGAAMLASACQAMDSFEASESQANTGTGARAEGNEFESIVSSYWFAVGTLAVEAGAQALERYAQVVGVGRNRRTAVHQRFRHGARSVFLPRPAEEIESGVSSDARIKDWLELTFQVSDMMQGFPGEHEAIARYAPQSGPYMADSYSKMYSGMTTTFDDAVVLADGDVLQEKLLLEYKTGKSSKGSSIDGNAHERLSYQMMQYLEVATRLPKCRFEVFANGAFRSYRNKYHLGFNQQADRLKVFKWFSMQYRCEAAAYQAFANNIVVWLTQPDVSELPH